MNRKVNHGRALVLHRLSQLFQSQQVRGQRLTVSELRSAIVAFGIEEIQQAPPHGDRHIR